MPRTSGMPWYLIKVRSGRTGSLRHKTGGKVCVNSYCTCTGSSTQQQPAANPASAPGSPCPRDVRNPCSCWKACSGFSWDGRQIRGTITALAAVLLNAEEQTHQIQVHRYLGLSGSGGKGAELCAWLVWSDTRISVHLSVTAPSCVIVQSFSKTQA